MLILDRLECLQIQKDLENDGGNQYKCPFCPHILLTCDNILNFGFNGI